MDDEEEGDMGEKLMKFITKKITTMNNEQITYDEFTKSLEEDSLEFTGFAADFIYYLSMYKLFDEIKIDYDEEMAIQREIVKQKSKLKKKDCEMLVKNFYKLARNPEVDKETRVYLTLESLKFNFVSFTN